MRINIRYDDEEKPANSSRDTNLCNVDLYLNTREDLITAQHLINGMLNILPTKPKAES